MLELGAQWTCKEDQVGMRLDKFLQTRLPDCSRSQIHKWIDADCFTLNQQSTKKNAVLQLNDKVAVIQVPDELAMTTLIPENIPLQIVFEDENLLVIDKPKGLVTHPGNGIYQGTLANALAYHFKGLSDLNGPMRPGIVHRLDKDTSGLLIVAKNNVTHTKLAKLLEQRDIHRIYRALAWRIFDEGKGRIEAPIGRSLRDPIKMTVREDGKPAITDYTVLDYFPCASSLELRLQTGRTHQIRVHLSHLGHPIMGDPLYGGNKVYLDKLEPLHQQLGRRLVKHFTSQALHAHRLEFTHPHTGKAMAFESPLPESFAEALEILKPFRLS